MGTILLLMMVLYGSISSQRQQDSAPFRHDYQLLGRPLFKLDISWPKYPELFRGAVFAVAVNPYAEVVYVAQRGKHWSS